MKRAMTVLAVIAAMGFAFGGCKKKPAEKKDDTKAEAMGEAMDEMGADEMKADEMKADEMKADEMKADEMKADEMKADDMGAAGDDTVGVAECDEYMKMYKCYLGKLPAAAKGPADAAYKKMIEAWKKSLDAAMGAGAAKDAIAKGCKTALDTWKKAMANNPMAKDCLK